MNERIDELWQEAVDATWIDNSKSTHEKFAELIVKQCTDILMIPEHVMNHHQELTDYYRGWVNGRLLGIEHIEKHLGVEE